MISPAFLFAQAPAFWLNWPDLQFFRMFFLPIRLRNVASAR